MEMKKTALWQEAVEAGAKMVEFSGWVLPLQYQGTLKEAKMTRTTCGIFDISHMGQLQISGLHALEFLEELTTNDISRLLPGGVQYNLFLNEKGNILDDFTIYRKEEGFFCIVNAVNTGKILRWLKENKRGREVEIIDLTPRRSLISLQGPNAEEIMEEVLKRSLKQMKYMSFIEEEIEGIKCIISRTGYTGEDGFEISMRKEAIFPIWKLLLAKGRERGLCRAGLGARDILRIEAGYPLYGNEIDSTINPIEASLRWTVKLDKDFIGKEKILEVINKGPRFKRVGFVMLERSMPRKGYLIYNQEGRIVGRVTSGTYSPNLEGFIGMGYVEKVYSQAGKEVILKIRENFYKAKIEKIPFLRYRHK